MKGNLSNFTAKVKQISKDVLNEYNPEIEVALGPAKVKLKLNEKQKLQEKQEEQEL